MSNGNAWRNLWAVTQPHVTVADFRVEVSQEIGVVRVEMERRFGEVNERLARIEALIQRLDPDYGQPAD